MLSKAFAEMKAIVAFVLGVIDSVVPYSQTAGSKFLDKLYEWDSSIAAQTELRAMNMAGTADRGQLGLGTILAAFVVVIATFVVLIVVDEFDQSVGTPQSSQLSNSQQSILSGFGSMTSLIEPLLLIAIGVVIIGLIRRVQG